MWEMLEWPPRTPRTAWVFIGSAFVGTVLGLIILFSL
jgi:hypothetical protein